jgi:hypothetical protein
MFACFRASGCVAAVGVGAVPERRGSGSAVSMSVRRRDQPLHVQCQEERSRPAVRVHRPEPHLQGDGGAQRPPSGPLLSQAAPQQPAKAARVSANAYLTR